MVKRSHEMLRMELQISELIRIVANLNERLRKLEKNEERKVYVNIQHLPKKQSTYS